MLNYQRVLDMNQEKIYSLALVMFHLTGPKL